LDIDTVDANDAEIVLNPVLTIETVDARLAESDRYVWRTREAVNVAFAETVLYDVVGIHAIVPEKDT
jgi:hypothetical protein